MKVLIAEDEPISRLLLQKHLEAHGFEVIPAKDGLEAWEIFQKEKDNIQMAIIDWMMPRMNGIDLCHKIRESKSKHYAYIIFLSGKGQKRDIVTALEAGADDYVTKPFDPDELKVRILAGKRIIELENKLTENNEKLRMAYETIKKDLEAAAEVQKKLLPSVFPSMEEIEFAARFIPSRFVSGDIYNLFRLDEHHIGFYQIDVSGHGVTAAFFSVSLYRRLTHDIQSKGLLKIPIFEPPYYKINPPEKVVGTLDRECADMLIRQGHYFTMIYAILNLKTWELSFCRAGHNPPFIY